MLKNTAGQKWRVFTFDTTTNQPVTGDAANITAKISLDYAAATALGDVNPTETEDGFYLFDLSQAETNANDLALYPESSTSNVQVIGVPGNYVTNTVAPSGSGGTTDASSSILGERVGHYLFGVRTDFSEDQQNDINDCVHDGLRRVYAAHDWSFLRPVADVVTTAPYATGTITVAAGVVTLTGGTFPSWAADGVLKVSSVAPVNNHYYSVASRDSDTQITLDTTSVTVAAAASFQLARPEIPLPAAFDSVANDSDLTYYPSPDYWYPPVRWRHDAMIRQLEGNNPEFDRPVFYSVRTVTFDATVGSRKVLALYPTPDQAYTLRVPMILRPVLIDDTNIYPIGGEMLSQVILEACLASAEHNFEEREHVHEKRFMELIGLAIRDDQERSSPTSLGPDGSRIGNGSFGMVDYSYRMREQRIGSVSLDGFIQ